MKSQEAAVYREIQKNTDMAMKAIDTIAAKAYDDDLALQIARQSLEYAEIYNEASRQLIDGKAELYRSSALSDAMQKTGIHYHTMLNTSTGRLAEMMIRENNNGILELEKVLRHNENAGEHPVSLAQQLIGLEEKNIKNLKKYL